MKAFFMLFAALFLFGCNVTVTTSDTEKKSPPPSEPQTIQLKSANGYQTIPMNNVTSVDVQLNGAQGSTLQVSRHFDGAYALGILKSLQLHAPTEPGLPSATITGTIILHMSNGPMASRKLSILNERMVQDSEFPEALYATNTVLNADWLAAMPPVAVPYNIASCLYVQDAAGRWQLAMAASERRASFLIRDERKQFGATISNARDGYCNLVTGTGAPESLKVTLINATAIGSLNLAPPCVFTGEGLVLSRKEKFLSAGEAVFVDFALDNRMNRNLMYFASPSEATEAQWAEKACRRIGAGF